MADLKPCPFCGRKAFLNSYPERKGFGAVVECTSCILQMMTVTYDTENEAEQAAISAWNRREYVFI